MVTLATTQVFQHLSVDCSSQPIIPKVGIDSIKWLNAHLSVVVTTYLLLPGLLGLLLSEVVIWHWWVVINGQAINETLLYSRRIDRPGGRVSLISSAIRLTLSDTEIGVWSPIRETSMSTAFFPL